VHINHPVFLFLAAFLAGTLNAVAGGGSFISFPALLFSGIAPIPANATNTAAVWPGTVASSVAYRNAFSAEARRLLPPLMVTGVFGGLLGARILLLTPQTTFMRIVPWLLLGATLIFAFSGRLSARMHERLRRRAAARAAATSPASAASASAAENASASSLNSSAAAKDHRPRSLFYIGLFLALAISMYIGYFGAGVGILVLALLAFLGMDDIHAMNAVKSLVVSLVNLVALVTFIIARVIVWPQAILMLVGASLGGYGGAYFAQKMNPQHIRYVVIVTGFAMSAYFFTHH
jgi:uncharacterized membrane protein YfcA